MYTFLSVYIDLDGDHAIRTEGTDIALSEHTFPDIPSMMKFLREKYPTLTYTVRLPWAHVQLSTELTEDLDEGGGTLTYVYPQRVDRKPLSKEETQQLKD